MIEIEIPSNLLVLDSNSLLISVVTFTDPSLLDNMINFKFFEDNMISQYYIREQVNQTSLILG